MFVLTWLLGVSRGDTWLFLPDLVEVRDVGACVVRLWSHVVAPVFRELPCLGRFASALLEFLLLWLVASFPAGSECVAAAAGGAFCERGCCFTRAAVGFVLGLRIHVGVWRRLREPTCGVAFTGARLWSAEPVEGVLALLAAPFSLGCVLVGCPLLVGLLPHVFDSIGSAGVVCGLTQVVVKDLRIRGWRCDLRGSLAGVREVGSLHCQSFDFPWEDCRFLTVVGRLNSVAETLDVMGWTRLCQINETTYEDVVKAFYVTLQVSADGSLLCMKSFTMSLHLQLRPSQGLRGETSRTIDDVLNAVLKQQDMVGVLQMQIHQIDVKFDFLPEEVQQMKDLLFQFVCQQGKGSSLVLTSDPQPEEQQPNQTE
ncbi:hypothetical protein Taro_047341 [Colocasia esculenta]|uniref:Uncharacterized protein n=1 Tax=Colocasia esculenta TaxID=4460 RepID=A0A843WV35_COLES|nr:hypothetical protein [Colocasia esculenta]